MQKISLDSIEKIKILNLKGEKMKSNNKNFVMAIAVLTSMMIIAFVSGQTIDGASTTGFFTVTQEAWFSPAWVVTSDAGYGLEANRQVNRAYVRIVEGSYDSQRVYSQLSTNNQSWDTISISTSKLNAPFTTMYTYYGWLYFN